MSSYRALKEILESLPLNEAKQQQAAELVRQCSTQELQSLGLSAPPRPVVPKNLEKLPIRERLMSVQKVIASIEYNHSPGYFYNVSKDRPFSRIMDTAREVLREAMPIKCIEAVFLGALLTAGWEGTARMPLGLKSGVNGETYRHIVLVIHHAPSQKWGALGISRREELMFKDLAFDSLSELVADFKAGYEKWWHKLHKARIGLPFEHDVFSNSSVCWRYCSVSPAKRNWAVCAGILDKFGEDYKLLASRFKVLGFAPPAPSRSQAVDAGQSKAAAMSVSPVRRRQGLQKLSTATPPATTGKGLRDVSMMSEGISSSVCKVELKASKLDGVMENSEGQRPLGCIGADLAGALSHAQSRCDETLEGRITGLGPQYNEEEVMGRDSENESDEDYDA
ncbi:hypothetical protein CEUSTIGMA_g7477.t1 [Chlamydomonas eustigma]|uniref:Vasohibin n=1 Tax=Chlamydomonas eustigma TaxID=1157962 RepID=A0A250XAD1_9CHLO|nr:hypothetical protein CEUSTIGMA_g7477.t1 [Chlamydomonas eustigma]|eukprot:GAX80038.1 hypothetical protein CEUSTIGMA_g7477.t1 [Chlamydomonas eustigma]